MSSKSVEGDLVSAGYRSGQASVKARLLKQASDVLDGAGTQYIVPGRVEVFGKHTDYCGGSSLLCATEQGLCIAARELDAPVLRVHALALGKTANIPLDEPAPKPAAWTTYPHAVARRLLRNFGPGLRGVEVAIASDLPQGAGLSSSSALIVGCFIALAERNQMADHPLYRQHLRTPEALAHYLGCMENGAAFGPLLGEAGVGTSGGSQDHTAILCARPGHLSQFSFCPVRRTCDVPMPTDMIFAIADSGVVAEKTGAAQAAYNDVSRKAREVLEHWNFTMSEARATLQEAVRTTPSFLWEATDEAHRPRLRQYIDETQKHLPAAVEALRRGDLNDFAEATRASQRSAENGLCNQVPETIHLARSADTLGASGACAFGAGFGGSVWALIRVDKADQFLAEWSDDYAAAFPQSNGTFFTTCAAPPAHALRG